MFVDLYLHFKTTILNARDTQISVSFSLKLPFFKYKALSSDLYSVYYLNVPIAIKHCTTW